jgi:hypothetical protein
MDSWYPSHDAAYVNRAQMEEEEGQQSASVYDDEVYEAPGTAHFAVAWAEVAARLPAETVSPNPCPLARRGACCAGAGALAVARMEADFQQWSSSAFPG